jgi:hypothetical protein
MTESRKPARRLPVGHRIARALLGSLVVALVVVALVLAVLHTDSELAAGRIVWASVKHWAIP